MQDLPKRAEPVSFGQIATGRCDDLTGAYTGKLYLTK